MNDKSLEGSTGGRQFAGILVAITLLALLIGLGSCAYSLGLAQGQGQGGTIMMPAPAAPATGYAPAPYPYYVGRGYAQPFGFFGGLVGCLVPIFAILIGLAALRYLFGRRHWAPGKGMGRGPWSGEGPSMFQEWHRRAHAGPEAGTPGPAGQAQGGETGAPGAA